jgi:hypothetical protein
MDLSLTNMLGFSSLSLYKSPLSVQSLQSRSCSLRYLTLQRHLRTALSLTTAKFQPLILSVSGSTLFYAANKYIIMVLYGFWLLPVQFSYIMVCMVWKPFTNRGPVCTLGTFQWCGEPCSVDAAISRGRCPPLIRMRINNKSLLIWLVPYGGLV